MASWRATFFLVLLSLLWPAESGADVQAAALRPPLTVVESTDSGMQLDEFIMGRELQMKNKKRKKSGEGDGESEAAEALSAAAEDAGLSAEATVAGGEKAACGRFPYMVSLRNADNIHQCGGVLVHPRWVLTAAHCVDPSNPSSAGATPIAVLGACNLDDTKNENGEVEVVVAKNSIRHENWSGAVEEGNDVALIELREDSSHTPIALPSSDDEVHAGQRMVAIGWGLKEDGSKPKDLQQATSIEYLRNSACGSKEYWGDVIQESMLCAFSILGQETCQGDSGGPLIRVFAPGGDFSAGSPSLDVAVGITSFRSSESECGHSDSPSVFTRLSSFRNWIDGNILEGGSPSLQPPTPSPTIPQEASTSPPVSPDPPQASQAAVPQQPQPSVLDSTDPPQASSSAVPQQPPSPVADSTDPSLFPVLVASPSPAPPPRLSPPTIPEEETETTDDDGPPKPPRPSPAEQKKLDKKLWEAAMDGDVSALEEALRRGASADAVGMDQGQVLPAIGVASFYGRVNVVKALVDAGAKKNKPSDGGYPALMFAAYQAQVPVVKALLKAGVDPNKPSALNPLNTGLAPIHVASYKPGIPSTLVVQALLDAGADINAVDAHQGTPLDWAAYWGNVAVAEMLLSRGGVSGLVNNPSTAINSVGVVCGCRSRVLTEGDDGPKCASGGCDDVDAEAKLYLMYINFTG